MQVKDLYAFLKQTQEKQGYYFNPDQEMVEQLLESLLTNKKRYGYMACPCRLASGNYELDKDILCPCVYREADVKEYGSCFCGLYVSKEVVEGKKQLEVVPERRPASKVLAALNKN